MGWIEQRDALIDENRTLEENIAKISILSESFEKIKSYFDEIKNSNDNLIELSENGKECFIKGACYCGDTIGESEEFQNLIDKFSKENEKLNVFNDTISNKQSLCAALINDMKVEIANNITKINNLVSINSGGAGGSKYNIQMEK